MKALSIRNPWAWYILHAHKGVENRGTRWAYRGPVLLHVGARICWLQIIKDEGESLQ